MWGIRGHPRSCLGRVTSVPCRFSGRVSSYLFTHPSCSSWMSWAAEPRDRRSNLTSMEPHLHLPGRPGCSAFAEPPIPWSYVCSQPPSLLSGVQWQSKRQSFPGQRGKTGTVMNFAVSKQKLPRVLSSKELSTRCRLLRSKGDQGFWV